MSRTDVFDLLGFVVLAVFGYAVWPPLSLLVVACALLLAARAEHRKAAK